MCVSEDPNDASDRKWEFFQATRDATFKSMVAL
jgi:hypothetical protein